MKEANKRDEKTAHSLLDEVTLGGIIGLIAKTRVICCRLDGGICRHACHSQDASPLFQNNTHHIQQVPPSVPDFNHTHNPRRYLSYDSRQPEAIAELKNYLFFPSEKYVPHDTSSYNTLEPRVMTLDSHNPSQGVL